MSKHLLPILLYHHVGVCHEPLGHKRLWISRERFEEQMNYLSRSGYRCLSLRDAAARLSEGTKLSSRTVVLTFDDAYDNFYQEAFPILSRFNLPATVFVVAQEVGGVNRWDEGPEVLLMGWREIRELSHRGVEIGSHSMSHPRLTRLSLEAARDEIAKSRLQLEDRLGTAINSFAYPYGDYSSELEKVVHESGYSAACSIVRGNLHAPRDRFHLKRVPIDEWTGLSRFQWRLSSIYDLEYRLRRMSKRMRGRPKSGPEYQAQNFFG